MQQTAYNVFQNDNCCTCELKLLLLDITRSDFKKLLLGTTKHHSKDLQCCDKTQKK